MPLESSSRLLSSFSRPLLLPLPLLPLQFLLHPSPTHIGFSECSSPLSLYRHGTGQLDRPSGLRKLDPYDVPPIRTPMTQVVLVGLYAAVAALPVSSVATSQRSFFFYLIRDHLFLHGRHVQRRF